MAYLPRIERYCEFCKDVTVFVLQGVIASTENNGKLLYLCETCVKISEEMRKEELEKLRREGFKNVRAIPLRNNDTATYPMYRIREE